MGIRVIILVPNGILGKGGIERLMLYFTRALPSLAPDISYAIHPTRFVETAPLNHFTTLISFIWFFLRLAFGNFDVAHINIAPRGSTWRKMAFVKLAQSFGLKTILHLHGSGYDVFFQDQTPSKQVRIRKLFQSVDKVIVLGEHWQAFATTELNLDASHVSQISNGAPDTERRAALQKKNVVIGFAGLIGERKGIDVLIDALSQLPADMPWTAEIGGNGEIERFRNLAKKRGISERIKFAGWLDEAAVAALMLNSQIFVLPSRAENQPMSIIEAMARGLPVIASEVGAIPEQVENGQTGLIVPAGDAEALSKAIASLIVDSKARERMGAAGRRRFEEKYSIYKNVEQFVETYRQITKVI